MPDTSAGVYREAIISLADRYRLPTIYPARVFVTDGGLMCYGIVWADLLRGAAAYVDRISGVRCQTNFRFAADQVRTDH